MIEGSQPSRFEQRIFAESGSSVYAVLHGDMHIRGGHPVYRFELFPLVPRSVDGVRARRQPSRLLAAESRVVPFTGRSGELSQLAAWRDDPAPGVSVLLVHGPGGQGKTRLAGEFAVESAEQGWTAWAGHHVSDPTAQLVVAPGETGSALVVVVEYAERWPADDLQLLLQNPLLRRPQRARVMLVSRPAEGWWPALRHRLGKAGITVGGTVGLQPLAETDVERRQVFEVARDQFATVFGVPSEAVPAPGLLDGCGYELVLTLHMAALVAVDAYARCDEAPPVDPIGLSSYLLDREHDYWQNLHDHDQMITTTPRAMARTVYTATLVRTQHRDQAIAILDRAGITTDTSAQTTLDNHAVCYPPSNPDLVLEPLYPDRLGEDFLALQTPGHLVADYTPDPWAATALAQLLTPAGQAQDQPAWTRPALTILIEAAHRWPHIVEHQLAPLLTRHPQLALNAGGASLTRLADVPGIGIQLLEGIEPHLPSGRHVDLDVGVAALTQRLTNCRLAVTTDDTARAKLYARLGERQINVGLHRQALASCEEAAGIYRQLAEINPDTHLRDLSESLHRVAIALSDLGRHEEALSCAEEVVGVDRQLSEINPGAYLPYLANSLSHLSIYLSNLGQWDDALATAEEAVSIYRPLANANVDAYLPDLAFSLDGLGTRLLELARPDDAAARTREAVAMYRRLAETTPNVYLPGLSTSVHNYGCQLSELGRREEALACSEEAVGIDRLLAAANPGAFLPDLGMSLNNLSVDMADLGRYEEAVTAVEESVSIRRRLAGAAPAAYLPSLAHSLYNLGNWLSRMGHRENALFPTEEATSIYRPLAVANPTVYLSDLAGSLASLSSRLSDLGRHHEAEAVGEEAVRIDRQLAEANPTAHLPGLAISLHNLARRLSKVGRRDEALASAEEAVGIDRGLAQANPAAYLPALAGSLNNLGERISELGRREDALAATEEAVRIYRSLAAADPLMHQFDLADSLKNLGDQMSELRRHEDALEAMEEAVRIYRLLAETSPDAHMPDLARGLRGFASVLASGRERLAEARDAIQQAVEIYGSLAERLPEAFVADLQAATCIYADVLKQLGGVDEAAAIVGGMPSRHFERRP